ncbi:MAG: tripartite tricarboxylate transporter permease, partial [Pseudomonadota bacterium]
LKTAAVSSVTGDFLGDCLLIFGAVWISQYTVRLGPPEYFAIYVMAFVVIGSVISDSVLKGLASALLGVLISFVGFSEITGETRYDFGSIDLMSGFTLPPLLIGLLVVSEVLLQSARRSPDGVADSRGDRQRARYSFADFKTCLPVSLRSSAIVALIGALPGLGSSVAAFVAYGEEKRRAGPDAKWGTGVIQGVAAPESANNAVNGPSMIPVLTLGIPGTTVAAVLIGVFVIHGVQVGPSIFQTSRDLVYGLFAAGLIAIVTYGLIGYFGGGLIGRIIAVVPVRVIYPTVFLLSIVAAYSLRNSLFDVLVVLVAGVAGFFMRKRGYSPAALIIAFILAGGAEDTLTQSMMMSSNGMLIFLERPAALVFFAIGLAAFAWRLRVSLRAEARAISSSSHSTGSVR